MTTTYQPNIALSGELVYEKFQKGSNTLPLIKNLFENKLAKIYGDQSKMIQKILNEENRECEIAYFDGQPIGLIVYKTSLQNEYDISNGFELKTLTLFNPEEFPRSGLGSLLFKRIDQKAKELGAKVIFCTGSSKVQAAVNCALKNDYKIKKVIKTDFKDGSLTLLLVKNL